MCWGEIEAFNIKLGCYFIVALYGYTIASLKCPVCDQYMAKYAGMVMYFVTFMYLFTKNNINVTLQVVNITKSCSN